MMTRRWSVQSLKVRRRPGKPVPYDGHNEAVIAVADGEATRGIEPVEPATRGDQSGEGSIIARRATGRTRGRHSLAPGLPRQAAREEIRIDAALVTLGFQGCGAIQCRFCGLQR
jgi:hypothetical protein